MTAIFDGRGQLLLLLRNINDDSDGERISEQRLADGDAYQYDYIFVKEEIVETIVDGRAARGSSFSGTAYSRRRNRIAMTSDQNVLSPVYIS
jgi:hypothetical protein